MSTRSAIGYQLPSGRIKAVYCHWDGHPDTKEPELKKYKNLELVRKLIKKGSMSSLETTEVWDGGGYLNNAREPQPLYITVKEVISIVGILLNLLPTPVRRRLWNSLE